jgi:mRNA interferase RelE/StbE
MIDVQRVSDTVCILNRGELVAQAPVLELLAGSGKTMFRLQTRGDFQQVRSLLANQSWVTALQVEQSDDRADWQVSVSDAIVAEDQLLGLVMSSSGVKVTGFGQSKEIFCVAGLIKYGYNIAIMKFELVFAPEADQDIKRLSARERAIVLDNIEKHLRYTPGKTSRTRIKRLRGISRPQYRLRIDDIRVYYDVSEQIVEILAIISKSKAADWLADYGEFEE